MPETNDSPDPENPAPIPDPYGVDQRGVDPTEALKRDLPADGEIDDLIDDSLTDDDFDAFVADGTASAFEEELGRPTPPPPPGPSATGPNGTAQRQLVRDPYATLGGVSSGLAHYFGFDVTLVRLVVLIGSLSTGIGFLVYLAAWIMIPRAEYWPPVPPASGGATNSIGRSSISGRNLGLGIVALGALLIFGFADGVGSFFVPFLLVAGGIWLLRQSPQLAGAPGAGAPSAAPMPVGTPVPPPPRASQRFGAATQTINSPYEPAAVGPMPVGKRSRRRRFARMVVITPIVLLPLLVLAGVGALIVFDEDDRNGFDLSGGESTYRPTSLAELDSFYEVDAGSIDLDLTALDSSMFAGLDAPVEVDVQVDFGAIAVMIPEDLRVSVIADADIGDLQVLGQSQDGPSSDIDIEVDDADVLLNLDVDLGEISVVSVSGQ